MCSHDVTRLAGHAHGCCAFPGAARSQRRFLGSVHRPGGRRCGRCERRCGETTRAPKGPRGLSCLGLGAALGVSARRRSRPRRRRRRLGLGELLLGDRRLGLAEASTWASSAASASARSAASIAASSSSGGSSPPSGTTRVFTSAVTPSNTCTGIEKRPIRLITSRSILRRSTRIFRVRQSSSAMSVGVTEPKSAPVGPALTSKRSTVFVSVVGDLARPARPSAPRGGRAPPRSGGSPRRVPASRPRRAAAAGGSCGRTRASTSTTSPFRPSFSTSLAG